MELLHLTKTTKRPLFFDTYNIMDIKNCPTDSHEKVKMDGRKAWLFWI